MSNTTTISVQFVDLDGRPLEKIPGKRGGVEQLPQFHIRYDFDSINRADSGSFSLLSTLVDTAKRALRLHDVSPSVIVVRAVLAGSLVELPSDAVCHRVVCTLYEELVAPTAAGAHKEPSVPLQLHVDYIPPEASFRALIVCCGYVEPVELTPLALSKMMDDDDNSNKQYPGWYSQQPSKEQQQLKSIMKLFEFVRTPFQYAELPEPIDPEHFFILCTDTTNSNGSSSRENFANSGRSSSSSSSSSSPSSACLSYTRISSVAALVRYLSSPLVVSSRCTLLLFCVRNTDTVMDAWKSAKAASVALGSIPQTEASSSGGGGGPRQFLRLQSDLRHELDCISSATMLVDFAREFHQMEYVASSFQRIGWAVATLLEAANVPAAPVVDRVRITRDNPWRWLLGWCQSQERAEIFLAVLRATRLSFAGVEVVQAVGHVVFNSVIDPRQLMSASLVLSALCSWCQSLVRASLWMMPEAELPRRVPTPRPPTPMLIDSRPSSSSSAGRRYGSKPPSAGKAYAFFYSQQQQQASSSSSVLRLGGGGDHQSSPTAAAAAALSSPSSSLPPARRFNNKGVLPPSAPPASSNIFFLTNKDAKSPLSLRNHSLSMTESPFETAMRRTAGGGGGQQQSPPASTKTLRQMMEEFDEMWSLANSPNVPSKIDDDLSEQQTENPLVVDDELHITINVEEETGEEDKNYSSRSRRSSNAAQLGPAMTLEQQRARSPAPPSLLHSSTTSSNSKNDDHFNRRAQRLRNERRRSSSRAVTAAVDVGQVHTPPHTPQMDLGDVASAMAADDQQLSQMSAADIERRSQLLDRMRNFDFGEDDGSNNSNEESSHHHHQPPPPHQIRRQSEAELRFSEQIERRSNSSTQGRNLTIVTTATGSDDNLMGSSLSSRQALPEIATPSSTPGVIEHADSFNSGSVGSGGGGRYSKMPKTKKRHEITRAMSDLAASAEMARERYVSVRFIRISSSSSSSSSSVEQQPSPASAPDSSASNNNNKKQQHGDGAIAAACAVAKLPAHIRVLEADDQQQQQQHGGGGGGGGGLLARLYPEGDPDHDEGIFIARATVDRSKEQAARMLREQGLRSGSVPVQLELVVDEADGSTVVLRIEVQPSKLSGGQLSMTFTQEEGNEQQQQKQQQYSVELLVEELCPRLFDPEEAAEHGDEDEVHSESTSTPTSASALVRVQSAFGGHLGNRVDASATFGSQKKQQQHSEALVRMIRVIRDETSATHVTGVAEHTEEGETTTAPTTTTTTVAAAAAAEIPSCCVALVNGATGSEICRTNFLSSSDSSSFFNPVFHSIDVQQVPSLSIELWAADDEVQPLARGSLSWEDAMLSTTVKLIPSAAANRTASSSAAAENLMLELSVIGVTHVDLRSVRGTWCVVNILSGVELLTAAMPPPDSASMSYSELAHFYRDATLTLDVFVVVAAKKNQQQQQQRILPLHTMELGAIDYLSNGFEGLDQTLALHKPEQLLFRVSVSSSSMSKNSSCHLLEGTMELEAGLYSKTVTVSLFPGSSSSRSEEHASPAALLKVNVETATTRSHKPKENPPVALVAEGDQQQQQQQKESVSLDPSYTLIVFQNWRCPEFPLVRCYVRTGKHRLLSASPLDLDDTDFVEPPTPATEAAAAAAKCFAIPTRMICDSWLALDFFDREPGSGGGFVGRVAVPLEDSSAADDDSGDGGNTTATAACLSSQRIRTMQLEVFTPAGAVENCSLMLSLAQLSVDPVLRQVDEQAAASFAAQVRREAAGRFVRHLAKYEQKFSQHFSLSRPAWSSGDETNLEEFVRLFFSSSSSNSKSNSGDSAVQLALERHPSEDVAFAVIDTDFKHNAASNDRLLPGAAARSVILCKPRNLLSGTALLSRCFVIGNGAADNSSSSSSPSALLPMPRTFINTSIRRDPGVLSALSLIGEMGPSLLQARCLVRDSDRLWRAFNAFGVYIRPFESESSAGRLIECVVMDDWLPAAPLRNKSGLVPLVAVGQSLEAPLLWPAALHKALAKHFDTFDVLPELNLAEAMGLLTGAPHVEIPLLLVAPSSSTDDDDNDEQEERQHQHEEDIFARLQKALDSGGGAACCLSTFADDDGQETIGKKGLSPGTAYPVLDVQVVRHRGGRGELLVSNMVLLRDPCRRVSRFSGKFRRDSPLWKRLPALRAACLCDGDPDDDEVEENYDVSTFWVALDEDETKDLFETCSFFFVSPPSNSQQQQQQVEDDEDEAVAEAVDQRQVHELRFSGKFDAESGASREFRRIEFTSEGPAWVNVQLLCEENEAAQSSPPAAGAAGGEPDRPLSPRRKREGSTASPGIGITLIENGTAVLQATDVFDQPMQVAGNRVLGNSEPTFVRGTSSVGFSFQVQPNAFFELAFESQQRKSDANFVVALWLNNSDWARLKVRLVGTTAETAMLQVSHLNDGQLAFFEAGQSSVALFPVAAEK